jgi:hypothetical protein
VSASPSVSETPVGLGTVQGHGLRRQLGMLDKNRGMARRNEAIAGPSRDVSPTMVRFT